MIIVVGKKIGEYRMTLDELKTLISEHDLTYSFSCSSMVYEAGDREYKVITRAFKTLDRKDKLKIIEHWNDTVNEKLIDDVSEDFEWRISVAAELEDALE